MIVDQIEMNHPGYIEYLNYPYPAGIDNVEFKNKLINLIEQLINLELEPSNEDVVEIFEELKSVPAGEMVPDYLFEPPILDENENDNNIINNVIEINLNDFIHTNLVNIENNNNAVTANLIDNLIHQINNNEIINIYNYNHNDNDNNILIGSG